MAQHACGLKLLNAQLGRRKVRSSEHSDLLLSGPTITGYSDSLRLLIVTEPQLLRLEEDSKHIDPHKNVQLFHRELEQKNLVSIKVSSVYYIHQKWLPEGRPRNLRSKFEFGAGTNLGKFERAHMRVFIYQG